MKKQIRVSTPGKVHFLGEHVVVYGKPALIAAIDKRCFITLTPRNDRNVEIVSKNFNISETLSIDKILEKTKKARDTWNQFIDTKDISYLTLITQTPLAYPFLAVGESLLLRSSTLSKRNTTGFDLEIDSAIPVGAGCGSSSAIAVTIAGAIQLSLDTSLDKESVFQTALATEEFRHGTPSGGDPATVLHGGFVWFQKKRDEKVIRPLNIRMSDTIARNFVLIDTGRPEESTGEMIGIVREFTDKHPKEAERIFDDQERLVKELVDAIEKNDSTLILYSIKEGEKNLERLGVVSSFVQGIISEIEKMGGAAKISGGGGKTKGTGMLVVYAPKRQVVEELCQKLKLDYFQTPLGIEGLRIE